MLVLHHDSLNDPPARNLPASAAGIVCRNGTSVPSVCTRLEALWLLRATPTLGVREGDELANILLVAPAGAEELDHCERPSPSGILT